MYIKSFAKITDYQSGGVFNLENWGYKYYCKCGAYCFWAPYALNYDDGKHPGKDWCHSENEGCGTIASPVPMVY